MHETNTQSFCKGQTCPVFREDVQQRKVLCHNTLKIVSFIPRTDSSPKETNSKLQIDSFLDLFRTDAVEKNKIYVHVYFVFGAISFQVLFFSR